MCATTEIESEEEKESDVHWKLILSPHNWTSYLLSFIIINNEVTAALFYLDFGLI